MKGPDLDRLRCEQKLSAAEFLNSYNEGLPEAFPRASAPILKQFSETYPELFKAGKVWSLDQHRKKLMDWLPMHVRYNAE